MAETQKNAEILEQALQDYENAYAFERANIDEANEDLKFRRGRREDQWDADALRVRKDRPCLTINLLPQFIRQVTGDIRQMRPAVKVNPVDSIADPKTAEKMAGMVRYIENRSDAKYVYTSAADSQVCAGIGHFRVTREYAASTTFNQELRVALIKDGVSVLWDPDTETPTREDAMFCHVPVDYSRQKFKKQWPNASQDGFAFEMKLTGDSWYTGDTIRVSEYWVKKPIKRMLALMPDGSIEDVTEVTKDFTKDELAGATEWYQQAKGARLEERDSFQVCRYLITASEILEQEEWPGSHIPIIPVVGEEVRIGRTVYRHGVVRYARDPQRMANYYASADAEVIALQPKAPWLVTRKQVEKTRDQWEVANTENLPYLEYDPDGQAPAPQRVQPPVASNAIQTGRLQAQEDMKRVIGIYDSGLGQRSNETSGVAIEARDRQSDTGTFVYQDNMNLAIKRCGQILIDLFPKVYDTQRQIRIIGIDGKEDLIDINKPVIRDGQHMVENDMTAGSYDVTLDVGPSYSTKRQEARAGMSDFMKANPLVAQVAGDLFAKMMDFPYADELSQRLEMALPPQIKQQLEAKEREENPDMQPSPEQQQAAQQQAEAAQVQQIQVQAGMAKLKAEVTEAQAKAKKAVADAEKAEAEAEQAKVELKRSRTAWAADHMDNLRTIHDHDVETERGGERHEADMSSRRQSEAVQ